MSDLEAVPAARRATRPPYAATAAVLLGFVALSQVLPAAKRAFGGNVPPLFAKAHPSVGPWVVLAVAVMGCGILALPRVMRAPTWLFIVCTVGFAWVLALALAASSSSGLAGISAPFRRPLDYWANVPLVNALGPRAFAEHFAQLTQRLSLHAQTHPPGAPLLLWLLSRLTGGSVMASSVLVALIGAAVTAPTYALAREPYGEPAARAAAVLCACSPGVLLYAATSMDAVFMTVAAAALAAIVRAPRSSGWAFAAGLLVVIGLCFTFGVALLGIVVAGVWWLAATDRPRRLGFAVLARRTAVLVAGGVAGVALARILLGIDLRSAFHAALTADLHDPSRGRSYLYWLVADIPAFLLSAGVAQSALLVEATRSRWRARRPGLDAVLWVTLVVASASGIFRGEVDHIWLLLVPLLMAVAGSAAAEADPRGPCAGGLGQALAEQLLLNTFW